MLNRTPRHIRRCLLEILRSYATGRISYSSLPCAFNSTTEKVFPGTGELGCVCTTVSAVEVTQAGSNTGSRLNDFAWPLDCD